MSSGEPAKPTRRDRVEKFIERRPLLAAGLLVVVMGGIGAGVCEVREIRRGDDSHAATDIYYGHDAQHGDFAVPYGEMHDSDETVKAIAERLMTVGAAMGVAGVIVSPRKEA